MSNKKTTVKVVQLLNLYKTIVDMLSESGNKEQVMQNGTLVEREVKFSAKVAYAMNKNIKKLWPIIFNFEQQKNTILAELRIQDPNSETGELIFKDGEAGQKEFERRIDEIINQDVEFEIYKVTLNDFGMTMLTVSQISNLEEFGMLVDKI